MLKVCCYGAIVCAAVFASTARAQVTVDWDVLGEDAGKPVAAVEKKAPEKIEKPSAPAKKPSLKAVGKKQKTSENDSDLLKPRANPVPVVKIISAKPLPPVQQTAPATPAEKPPAVTAPRASKTPPVPAVRPVETAAAVKEEQTAGPTSVIAPAAPVEKVEAVETSSPATPASVVETAEKSPEPTPAVEQPTPEPVVEAKEIPSPFDTDDSLSEREKSDALAALLPAGCPTLSMLSPHKTVHTVLEFEPKSALLTDKSVPRLDKLADYLTSHPEKKAVVVSYTAPLSPEFGRERQLTLRRALAVRSALAEKGVRTLRVEIRSSGANGAGDKYPDRADIIVFTR